MSFHPDLDELVPPPAMCEVRARFDDDVETSLFEAAVVGDVGFEDRVFGAWSGDPDFGAPPDPPDPPGWRPADPIEGMGAAGWLRTVAVAQSRADARWLAAIHYVAHHGGRRDGWGRPLRDEGGVDEVAVAMGWSRSMAADRVTLAEAVIDRMPRLHEAMVDGRLDVAKVSTIARHTATMPPDLAGAVAARVEDLAGRVSCTELAEVIASVAVQLDPDWARRREQVGRQRARVEYSRTPEGTADVALRDVSAAAGVRVRERIEALAWPLRAAGRAEGMAVGIGAARAMVAERLCDGGAVGLDDPALLDQLITELPAWLAELRDDDGPGPDSPDNPEPGPDDNGPDDGPDGGPGDSGPGDSPDDSGPGDSPDDGGPEDGGPVDGGRVDGSGGGPDGGADDRGSGVGGPEVWAGTTELRMRLSTALGLDELPGQLPGSGILTAPAARAMLEGVRRGDVSVECRLVLTDDDGHLEHVLLVPLPRETQSPDRRTSARGSDRRARGTVIVELAATTTLLRALNPDHPTLTTAQHRQHWSRWLRRAQTRLAALPAAAEPGGARHPATSLADAGKRFAGRALDRYIRTRDRHCVGPYCTEPAYRSQIDHTHDWHRHGRTQASNLGAPCAHCHRLKSKCGWRLEQPEPGRFVWHTPLGQTHHITPRPVLTPPAEPLPRNRRPRPVLDTRQQHRPGPDGWIDHRPRSYLPAAIPQPPRARPPRPSDDEPPPF